MACSRPHHYYKLVVRGLFWTSAFYLARGPAVIAKQWSDAGGLRLLDQDLEPSSASSFPPPKRHVPYCIVRVHERSPLGSDRLGLGFFIRGDEVSSRYGALVTEIARSEKGNILTKQGVRAGMVVQKLVAGGKSIGLYGISTDRAMEILDNAMPPFALYFAVPGDCLVTLGTDDDSKYVNYDEADFFRRGAGGVYFLTEKLTGRKRYLMGRRHNRMHSSYAMHQITTTQYSLTVFDSGQWMIETRTNLDYEDGHNDHLCYATENVDAETKILPTKYMKQGEKEIRWWRQQLNESGELQLKLKGIGFLPHRYHVDREVVDRHVRLDVVVCPKQVQMWLQNGWLKLKSVSGFDKALHFVELRRYVSFQNIWAECDVDLCGEKACNAGKNGLSKQFENIIFMGASLLDLECLEIHGAASMQGSMLSERYKEDNRTEDILAEHLKHMLAESLCPTGVVMISFQARYHPAFRENFKIFATQDIENRTKDPNLQLCGENQAKMDNFYRGSNNGSLRYSFSTTYVAAEIRDGQDLSGNFAIFGKRRQWARILRTCTKCPRHWVPLTSPNGDISYVDISYVEIDSMRKEGSLCQTRDVVLMCNAGRPDCLPHWAHNKHDYDACPYGTRLPGDVTLPTRRSFTTWLSIVYGYVPVLYILLCAWRFVKTPGTRSMSILCFIAITTLFHELIVKKHVVRQPRPVGSCNTTCGMPSSHSAMAIGYLVVALMDSIFRTDTRLREKWGDVLKPKLVFPVVHGPKSFAVQIWLWCMLLLPVPLSRVVLRDHSISQVFCGGSLGFIEALLWTLLVRKLQRAFPPDQYPRLLFGKLRHNYGHPTFYREQVREKLEGKRNELVQTS